MSWRSSFVSDVLSRVQAERVAAHIGSAVQLASIIRASDASFIVAGYINSSADGLETELLEGLPPLAGCGRLVINTEGGSVVAWNLEKSCRF